jgi:heme/copper-type cytochrome/quinol oxidase subunit 2
LTPRSGLPQPHPGLTAVLDVELVAGGVNKLNWVARRGAPQGSPRQPSSHVMIVVVIVVVVVMMVVMVVVVMVVVVLLGECRERREAKCGAEC